METAAPSPFVLLPPRGSRVAGSPSACLPGTADLPSAVPGPASASCPRQALIGALRQSIAGIERPLFASPAPALTAPRWVLGDDAGLPLAEGLEEDALHEVKGAASLSQAAAGGWMAGLGFALRLAARRLAQADAVKKGSLLLWCAPQGFLREYGSLSWHGLSSLGLDPSRMLLIETAREAEALGALEEGLKSGAIALGLGIFEDVALNPARRLSLAAGAAATPCLLVTHPSRAPAAATATRWRIARAPSGVGRYDPRAPGALRFAMSLDRCRASPQSAGRAPVLLEWCDETHAFRVAARMADRASQPRRAGLGAAR